MQRRPCSTDTLALTTVKFEDLTDIQLDYLAGVAAGEVICIAYGQLYIGQSSKLWKPSLYDKQLLGLVRKLKISVVYNEGEEQWDSWSGTTFDLLRHSAKTYTMAVLRLIAKRIALSPGLHTIPTCLVY